MKKMFRKTATGVLLAVLTVYSVQAEAAFSTDIIGQTAITSFRAMLDALEFPPVVDEEGGMWVLTAPDGEAAFGWRREDKEERLFDVYLSFDVAPFIKAGLDPDKMPAGMKGRLDRGQLMAGKKFTRSSLVYTGEITPLASFEQLVRWGRGSVGYHAALDHYGVSVADGWLVEWAKDMDKNDKDLVFVLDPKLLIAAGVDPAKVEGWVYAKVPLEDARGRKFEAEKFLKPFNLR